MDDYAKQWKLDCRFVGNVHDEVQTEVKELLSLSAPPPTRRSNLIQDAPKSTRHERDGRTLGSPRRETEVPGDDDALRAVGDERVDHLGDRGVDDALRELDALVHLDAVLNHRLQLGS